MSEAKLDVEGLYAALDVQRKHRKLSWRKVANETHVGPSTFTRMAQGHRPDVDAFAALVAWLGVPAERFLTKSGPVRRKKGERPVAMISTYLRGEKNLSPNTAKAMEDIIEAAFRLLEARERER